MSDYHVSVWTTSCPETQDPDLEIVVTDATDADEAIVDGLDELDVALGSFRQVSASQMVGTSWGTFED